MNVLEVLQKIGYTNVTDLGKEYRTAPLYRPSDNNTSLCVNKSNGTWYDFGASCGGSLLQLIKITLGLGSLEEAKKIFGDVSLQEGQSHRVELSDIKRFDKALLSKLVPEHSYWLKRRVSKDTVSIFCGGVARTGRMTNRYVFPIYNLADDIIGFSGRLLDDNPNYPKWKHVGSKSNWCYPLKWNKDILASSQKIILVESIGDMLSLWEAGIKNTLVTFGIDISVRLIEVMLRYDAQKILIAFNNDSGNNLVGNEAAIRGRHNLLSYFDERQVEIAVPDQKDFGEMNAEQITTWKQKYLQL